MPVQKVTDPAKKATDPVLLSHLVKAGIDKGFVEFVQDYAARAPGCSPYTKRYKDLKSNKNFLVSSGLPMCRADGTKLTPGWERGNKTHYAKTNLFEGEIKDNGQIIFSPTNDQPSGAMASDLLIWQPQLYLGGIEVAPVSGPVLLPLDPANPNYSNNTLQWDYGICLRRIRTIEGKLYERWLFSANPGADVRIVHNHTGKGMFKLGEHKTDNDIELIPLAVFMQASYPFTISATLTVYPDAHAESATVDGRVYQSGVQSFAVKRAGAGNGAADNETDLYIVTIASTTCPNFWDLERTIFLYDVGAISGDTVSAVTKSIRGVSKANDNDTGMPPDVNVVESAPASNTELVGGDYNSLGTTLFCDTTITYAAWDIGDFNDFVFNATGITFVQAAVDGDGIVKLGCRHKSGDIDNQAPDCLSSAKYDRLNGYYSDKGAGFKPKLVITHIGGLPDVEESIDVTLEVEAETERKLTFPISPTIEPKATLGRSLGFPLSSLVEVEAVGTLHIALLKSISVTLEVGASGERLLTFPLSAMLEVEASGGKLLTFPITPTIEVEAVAPLHLLKALSVTLEVEAAGGKILTFPISSLIEVEAEASYRMGLEKSISVTLEVGAEGQRLLFFPLSALIEVEAAGGRHLIKPLSALIEPGAVGAFRAGLEGSVSATLEVEVEAGRLLTFPISPTIEVEAAGQMAFIWSFIKDHQIILDIWGTEEHIH